jgi:FkbM family methyltransferase
MMTGGLLANLSGKFDRMGFRPVVAAVASAAYGLRTGGRQRFFADQAGNWVNHHSEATIVSPTIHTARFDAYREAVLDNWAWQYRPQPGDTVVDVGAGVGEEAVVFSKLVGPRGKVLSIEAHPETYNCLLETIRRSSLKNVVPICVAVTDCDGVAFIGSVENHIANSIFDRSANAEVPARSLDSIADELGLDKIDLLKMNIEGAERLAVHGMDKVANRVRHAVISCHDFISDLEGPEEFRTFDEVRTSLDELGFKVVTRPEDRRPWVRFYAYARNRSLS